MSRLKNARLRAELTQAQLAKDVGVTRQTINLLENGRYNPTLKLCLAICHRLDSSLDQLFWEEPNCHS
ncbi:MAG: helix-turn-helix transcriptional regulator [Corynebacterium sp.]|uniref:helix-turn-helix transcriptional regulator n=1 Tax=unclassified Corynebacterium TaxID=2624378 RepID=UPI00280C06C2|nr:helix-turn-helix transcriptional regulator [Corynebacterium sp.]MDU3164800.1 helix-turn-helix transcriptional regulator [Corynebacterium sp.]MDU4633172.1 helix-turn-helix transcriptional regulator [Corynebacterium sp.]MDU5327485.1 helix-turn-helix transcriptional regulator [Corynebacterium sp.]MDU6417778.1 helix-turn-helix transcriptional regulator [Corynebacterium sp.]MDU6592935.1 helix-turn-helix transcriptional regulator [Corynebacterium sp.]